MVRSSTTNRLCSMVSHLIVNRISTSSFGGQQLEGSISLDMTKPFMVKQDVHSSLVYCENRTITQASM